jgi:WD40 repeat protein
MTAVATGASAFMTSSQLMLVIASKDHTRPSHIFFHPPEPVKIIDSTTGQVVVSESAPPSEIGGLNYTPDGRYLVENGDFWKTVRIWDGEHRNLLQEIPVHAPESFAVTVSSDSRYLAVSDRDRVTVWKLQ